MKFLKMIRYPYKNGIILPFKIYNKVYIKIKTTDLKLGSRLVFGNSKEKAVISVNPINLFFGYNTNVSFGKSVSLGPGTNIIIKENAFFSIGDNTYITSDTHIEAVNSITIGENCAISWGVTIIDDDHHQLMYFGKKVKENIVKIGDKVWIGCNVTILKGTVIDNNSVIAAGSVVSGIYPENSLIAGNPAKVIKKEISWE